MPIEVGLWFGLRRQQQWVADCVMEALLEAMRPGHVQASRRGSREEDSENLDSSEKEGAEETTLEDLERQQGLDDDDDDYEEPLSRQLAQTRSREVRVQTHGTVTADVQPNEPASSGMRSESNEAPVTVQTGDRTPTFSSVVRTQPARAVQHQHAAARLSQLHGPYTHSLPILPSQRVVVQLTAHLSHRASHAYITNHALLVRPFRPLSSTSSAHCASFVARGPSRGKTRPFFTTSCSTSSPEATSPPVRSHNHLVDLLLRYVRQHASFIAPAQSL
ncbi:hypothetical protein NUW54_g14260 [Trametes sanguinea]|uniref:Uncharacterized protein n=1 Tax=Trametes sanguinea TaxID=158606 RepID=A0ACC1MFM0_9APHY|nr:hypothetical protein NUW54_g14260 [Trametes sanguinea]